MQCDFQFVLEKIPPLYLSRIVIERKKRECFIRTVLEIMWGLWVVLTLNTELLFLFLHLLLGTNILYYFWVSLGKHCCQIVVS